MAKAPKVVRRDLKEDKVYLTMAEIVDYVVRYRLWISLAVLAGVIAFGIGYFLHLRSRDVAAEASWALYKTNYVENPSEKIAALEEVATSYASMPAGRLAAYFKANALYEEGKYQDALKAFQEFLKGNPRHLLAPSAMEAIGFCQESLGQWQEAIDTYMNLIKEQTKSPAAARINYRIGLCFQKLGQQEKAREAYGATQELLPGSLWAEYAAERMSMLSAPVVEPSEKAAAEPIPQKTQEP